MSWIRSLEEALKSWAQKTPVEIFACAGAFVEEVVAPIPSPLVMATAGSIAFAQGKGVVFLVWLAVLGAVGKLAGAGVVYWGSAALEHVVIGRFGKFLGVTHKDVENLRNFFRGGWRDHLLLFVLRAAPVMPSTPVSVACGVIRMKLSVFVPATLAGNFVRNFIYIYLGYGGLSAWESLLGGFENAESVVQILLVGAFTAFVAWVYFKRTRGGMPDFLKRFFKM